SLVAADAKRRTGKSLETVEHAIRGPLGTVVSLSLKRRGGETPSTVHVTRAQIHVPSVRAKLENGIEYVRLSDFGTTSAQEVREAFLDGKKNNAHGYILDLRMNGGGLLDAAVDISSLFISQGTI